MSKRYAHIALWVLVVLFVLSVVDALEGAPFTLIPEGIVAIATAILAGVAIGAIVRGLTQANGSERSPDE